MYSSSRPASPSYGRASKLSGSDVTVPSAAREAPNRMVLLPGKIGSVQNTCFRLAWHTSHSVESTLIRGDMASPAPYSYAGSVGSSLASSAARCEPDQSYRALSPGATTDMYCSHAPCFSSACAYSASKLSSIAFSTLSDDRYAVSTTRFGGRYAPAAPAQHVCDWFPPGHTHP